MTHFLLHVGDLFHTFAHPSTHRESVPDKKGHPAAIPDWTTRDVPDELAFFSLSQQEKDPPPREVLGWFALQPDAEMPGMEDQGTWPEDRWL